jgi:hypothetical protein
MTAVDKYFLTQSKSKFKYNQGNNWIQAYRCGLLRVCSQTKKAIEAWFEQCSSFSVEILRNSLVPVNGPISVQPLSRSPNYLCLNDVFSYKAI